jgi:dihydrolipoamide dehydrogenase
MRGRKVTVARNRSTGEDIEIESDEILVAAGRRSNADMLALQKSDVQTDDHGWILVNEYLETTCPGVWAIGDCIGKHMFRHAANYEASIVATNILKGLERKIEDESDSKVSHDEDSPENDSNEMTLHHEEEARHGKGEHRHVDDERQNADDDAYLKVKESKELADFHAVPHAVFCHPPVAGVGLTQEQAVALGYDLFIGRALYSETAKGYAMAEEGSMAKAIVDGSNGVILGFHAIGPDAPELVQQVTYLMNAEGGTYMPLARAEVIHPSVSEVVARAFGNLEHLHHFGE